MSADKTSGPAFPCDGLMERDDRGGFKGVPVGGAGMTLRDYFAAKAMPELYRRVESGGFERVAKLAYEMADCMLAAREAP